MSNENTKAKKICAALVALEGLGRTGGAEDAKKLVIWMHSEDPEVSAAARRGLILLSDARANRVLADELKAYEKDPAFLAKLLDVLTVRNPLGLGGAIAPYLAHADADVRVQAYRALALQGMAPEMPAVLAAAGKATDKKERKEARRVDPSGFTDLLTPEEIEKLPCEAKVVKESFRSLFTAERSMKIPWMPPMMSSKGFPVVSLTKVTAYLAQIASKLGAEIYTGFAVTELVEENGSVVGARTGEKGLGKDGRKKSNYLP